MKTKSEVLAAEQGFFVALVRARLEDLDQLLSEDFTLVDAMSGGVVSKSALIAALSSGQLTFQSIDPADALVRLYETSAISTGRTHMKGTYAGAPFTVHSRYTHVYVEQKGHWRLAAAQGTPITGPA